MSLEFDLYEVLEVPSDADDAAIRTAYFRMARVHPPDKDPRAFERIRQAYQTLSNRKTRQDYDAMRRFGGEIEETLRQAEQAIAEKRNEDAARAFRHVLALNPGLDAVRDQLALCLLMMKEYPEAVGVLETLVAQAPDNAVYWHHLGSALSKWSTSLSADGAGRQGQQGTAAWFARAREAYSRAIQLEPGNPDLYRGIGWTYVFQFDHARAIEWFRKSIDADDKIDLFDIDALTDICFAAAYGNLDSEFRDAYEDVIGIVSNGPKDARDYAARCLAKHGWDAYSSHIFVVARKFFQAAHTIGLLDPEAQAVLGKLVALAGAGSEMDRLVADDSISLPFRTVIFLRVADAVEYPVQGRAEFEERAAAGFVSLDRATVERCIKAVRLSYPSIYSLNKDFLDWVRSTLNGNRPTPPVRAAPPQINTDHGCLIPILAILGITALILMMAT